MTRGDQLIERGATRLEELSRRAAANGGLQAKLADELAEDAEFLRKLKPSLIAARARGESPAGQPAQPPPSPPPAASRPDKPKKRRKKKGGGPSPVVIVGAALVTGILLAKVLDWRGHAHPRD